MLVNLLELKYEANIKGLTICFMVLFYEQYLPKTNGVAVANSTAA